MESTAIEVAAATAGQCVRPPRYLSPLIWCASACFTFVPASFLSVLSRFTSFCCYFLLSWFWSGFQLLPRQPSLLTGSADSLVGFGSVQWYAGNASVLRSTEANDDNLNEKLRLQASAEVHDVYMECASLC